MKTAVSSIVISFFSLAFFGAEATENREVPNDGRAALLVDTEGKRSSLTKLPCKLHGVLVSAHLRDSGWTLNALHPFVRD